MTEFQKRILAIVVCVYFALCILTLIILLIECERNGEEWRKPR